MASHALGALAVSDTEAAGLGEAVAALALHEVKRSWRKQPVLKGATLILAPGTVAWLGGPNGAGKTTLLRIAAGLIAPHAGSVRLFGLDPERDRRAYYRRLGYLSAGDRGLYARLTTLQNMQFWAGLMFVPMRRRSALVNAAVRDFELEELADRRADRLSMGQRQRVRLAMAFMHEPGVVLLDEPHTSLDDAGLRLADAALERLRDRGGTALWCSPASSQLPLRAEAKFELEDGRVVRR